MRPLGLSLLLLPLAFARLAGAEPPPVALEDAYPALALLAPSDIQDPGDGSGRLFAVEVPGRIIGFENDADVSEGTVFLDLSSVVSGRGMNGLAFHPDHAGNGFVYAATRSKIPTAASFPASPSSRTIPTASMSIPS